MQLIDGMKKSLLLLPLLAGCGTMVNPVDQKALDVVVAKEDVRLFNNPTMFIPKGQRFNVTKMASGERIVMLHSSAFVFSTHIGVVIDDNNCTTGQHVSRDITGWQIHDPKALSFPADLRTSIPYPFCFTRD